MATIIRTPAISSEKRTLVPAAQEAAASPVAYAAQEMPAGVDATMADQLDSAIGPVDVKRAVAESAAPAAVSTTGSATAAPAATPKKTEEQLRQEKAAAERQRQLMEQKLEAERIKAQEQEKREQERQRLEQAYKDAQARGYQDGFKQGDEDARSSYLEAQGRLEAITAKLEETLEQGIAGIEDTAVAIVFEAICKILGDAMVTREGVIAQVRQVTARVRERGALLIRLHPRDLELVQECNAFGVGTKSAEIAWAADDSLSIGGCVVETTGGEFDARLDMQLDQIRNALAAARLSSSNAEAAT